MDKRFFKSTVLRFLIIVILFGIFLSNPYGSSVQAAHIYQQDCQFFISKNIHFFDNETETPTPTKTNTPRPTSTRYPSATPTPTPAYYYRTNTPTSSGSIKTSTPLPDSTRIIQEQTLTVFFITQTARYSDPTVESTPESNEMTFTEQSPSDTPRKTEEALTNLGTETIETKPCSTPATVNTDKTDRYQAKQNPTWLIWLIFLLFGIIPFIIFTRNRQDI